MKIKWPWVSRKKYEKLQKKADAFLQMIETMTKAENMLHSMQMMAVEVRASMLAAEIIENREAALEDLRI